MEEMVEVPAPRGTTFREMKSVQQQEEEEGKALFLARGKKSLIVTYTVGVAQALSFFLVF